MQLKAVAFDLDGTLYPNSILYMRVIPLFFRYPRIFSRFGRVRRKIRKIRPIDDFYTLQAEMFAREMGVGVDESTKIIDTIIYPAWAEILGEADLYAGVREVFEELQGRGLKLGVLSDFPVPKKLELLKIDGIWDYAYSSEEVGYLKPNPEPFHHLADALSLSPSEVLYVGNNFDYDIVGAANVGMKTAYLSRKKNAGLSDIRFSKYHELVPKMKTANFL